ncbi:hypothetical protein LPJ70_007376 [Coemansia sp. RSA 2708]|nr:hypothetical protein LPJ70_007376 [Coemansia sp. RSA 2708]
MSSTRTTTAAPVRPAAAPTSKPIAGEPIADRPIAGKLTAGKPLLPTQIPRPALNPAMRALEKRKGGGVQHKLPQHVRAGLSSPTDKIQSPATKAVRSLRHKQAENLPAPRMLGSVFKAMQEKAIE